jgi:prevent-host-death family protein
MQQVNIHVAKTHLSALVENAAKGASFIIAKSGKPMVTVIPYSSPHAAQKRIGFLKDQISVPGDFDQIGQDEITAMFEGQE